jgi:haloacetate dehalogenase
MMEDYRAGLGLDRCHDDEDRHAGRRVACPVLVLWATGDDLADLDGDILDVWRPWAHDLRGRPFPSGHHMADEAPERLATELLEFLTRPKDA